MRLLLCNTHTIFRPHSFSSMTKQTATTDCNGPYLESGILSNQLNINTSPHRLGGSRLNNGFLCGGLTTWDTFPALMQLQNHGYKDWPSGEEGCANVENGEANHILTILTDDELAAVANEIQWCENDLIHDCSGL